MERKIADLVAIIRVITQGSSQYGKVVAEYTQPAEFTAVNGEKMQRIESEDLRTVYWQLIF